MGEGRHVGFQTQEGSMDGARSLGLPSRSLGIGVVSVPRGPPAHREQYTHCVSHTWA